MSVNVSIKVDGENWSGDVDKLRTDVPGGGRKDWTPHVARRYISLTVPGTGVYYAEDYDAYAIAEITVKKDAEIDAETYDYPDEYQPVAVSEGGRKYFFQVRGLRTNDNRWDPEERPLYSKVVYDYGTYRAGDEEKKGWLSVAVNIASQPKQRRDPALDYQTGEWIPLDFIAMGNGAIDRQQSPGYGNPIAGHYGFDGIQVGTGDFYLCWFVKDGHSYAGTTAYFDYETLTIKGIPPESCSIQGEAMEITPNVLTRYRPGMFYVPDWRYSANDPDKNRSYLIEYMPRELSLFSRLWDEQAKRYYYEKETYTFPDDVKCVGYYYPRDEYYRMFFYALRDGIETFEFDWYIHRWSEDEDGNIYDGGEAHHPMTSRIEADAKYNYYRVMWDWLQASTPTLAYMEKPDTGYLNYIDAYTGVQEFQRYVARPGSLHKCTAVWRRPLDDFEISRDFYVMNPEAHTQAYPRLDSRHWNVYHPVEDPDL